MSKSDEHLHYIHCNCVRGVDFAARSKAAQYECLFWALQCGKSRRRERQQLAGNVNHATPPAPHYNELELWARIGRIIE